MKVRSVRVGRVGEPGRADAAAGPREDVAALRAARFGTLPARILPEQMVQEIPADAPNDPEFGRNADNDWLVRYSL